MSAEALSQKHLTAPEAEMAWKNQLYQAAIDSLDGAIDIVDADMRVVIFNAAFAQWCKGLGFQEDPTNRNLFELFPFLPEKVHGEYRRVFETGEIIVTEDRYDIMGQTIYTETRKAPVYQDGKVVRVVTATRDITERAKLAEIVAERTTELQASQSLLHAFLDNLPFPAFTKDLEGRTTLANRQFAQVFNIEPAALIGTTTYDIMPKEIADGIVASEAPIMESGKAAEVEEVTYEPDGLHHALTIKFPIRDEDGKVSGLGAIVIDITERKKAEAERQRMQEEIIEAQRRALQELSTPIIPILDRIIVMPLIGSIDTMRSRDITRALLRGISEYRAKIVILDVTGVPIVDSGVAGYLDKTIQAARLKGAKTIVTGISDAVAEAIIDLGIDWGSIETLRDLQAGLLTALKNLGIRLGK